APPWSRQTRARYPSPRPPAPRRRCAARWRMLRASRERSTAERDGSSDRRHVEQAALGPQAVEAAVGAERLEIGVETLGRVADLSYDAVGPAVVERHHLAEVAACADKA